jgi:hypothetical protein
MLLEIPKDALRIIIGRIDSVTGVMCRLTCWSLWTFIKVTGNCKWNQTLDIAAIYGYTGVMDYLINTGSIVSPKTSYLAGEYGQLASLKYLKSKNLLDNGETLGRTMIKMEKHAIPFDTELLDFLDDCRTIRQHYHFPEYNMEYGRPDKFDKDMAIKILNWIVSRNSNLDKYGYYSLLRKAVRCGPIELLEWYKNHGETFKNGSLLVSECCNIEIMEWFEKYNLLNDFNRERLEIWRKTIEDNKLRVPEE